MNQTAHKQYQKSDAELNKVYQQLIKKLNKSQKSLLIIAQKNWLKFRDAHCKFVIAEYAGGSMQPLVYSNCLTELTEARIEDLKQSLTKN